MTPSLTKNKEKHEKPFIHIFCEKISFLDEKNVLLEKDLQICGFLMH